MDALQLDLITDTSYSLADLRDAFISAIFCSAILSISACLFLRSFICSALKYSASLRAFEAAALSFVQRSSISLILSLADFTLQE